MSYVPKNTVNSTSGTFSSILEISGTSSLGLWIHSNTITSNNLLEIDSDSSDYLVVQGNGKTGIGTATPNSQTLLDINNSTSGIYASLINSTQSNSHGLWIKTTGIASNINLLNLDASTNSILVVKGDGKIGVGTASPTGLFEIVSGNNVFERLIGSPSDGDTALLILRNVGGSLTLQQVSMGIDNSGGVGFKVLRVPN